MLNKKYKIFFLNLVILVILFFSFVVKAEERLIGGLCIGQGEPYVFDYQERGILFDIVNHIFKEAQISLDIVYRPAARIRHEFRTQKIDLEIGINPIWRKEEENISIYSLPFLNNINSLAFLENNINYSKKNAKIGTINSWSYPALEQAFKSGALIRQDYNTFEQQINNLLHKRVDLIIANKRAIGNFVKRTNSPIIIGNIVSETKLMLRFHKSKQNLVAGINEIIRQNIANGTIEQISKKYQINNKM